MKTAEKQLIINLFKKIQNISLQTPNKDIEATKLINFLLQSQNDAIYYMVQTLLVQDIIIQELNDKIQKLENKENQCSTQNTSFLPDHVKEKVCKLPVYNDIQSNTKNHNAQNIPHVKENTYFNNKDHVSNNTGGGISSFLGNAMQTAVGVAGGMVAGNILANILNNHDKPSDTIHHNTDIGSSEHIDTPINNFFQVDDSNTTSEYPTEDSYDIYDLDEDF
ncbi:DUF2076 domain-containing protein [Buchnera aphidicola]|nr:DUF2076 domain-containing protein [Buchnera aphidicola]